MGVIEGRKRKDFEVSYNYLNDTLQVTDKKERRKYSVSFEALMKLLFDIEMEEIIYVD